MNFAQIIREELAAAEIRINERFQQGMSSFLTGAMGGAEAAPSQLPSVVTAPPGAPFSGTQRDKIENFLRHHPQRSKRDIAKGIGTTTQNGNLHACIRQMMSRGEVVSQGQGRAAVYLLNSSGRVSSGASVKPTRKEMDARRIAVITFLENNRGSTMSEIINGANPDNATVASMTTMVRRMNGDKQIKGRLDQHGAKRYYTK